MTFQQISNTWWYRLLKVIWIFLLIIITLIVGFSTYTVQNNQIIDNNQISEIQRNQMAGWVLFSMVVVQLIFIGIRQIFLYIIMDNKKTEL